MRPVEVLLNADLEVLLLGGSGGQLETCKEQGELLVPITFGFPI